MHTLHTYIQSVTNLLHAKVHTSAKWLNSCPGSTCSTDSFSVSQPLNVALITLIGSNGLVAEACQCNLTIGWTTEGGAVHN